MAEIPWCQMLIATSAWSTCYFIVSYYFKFPPEWSSRVIAGLHGFLVSVLAVWNVLALGEKAFNDFTMTNTPYEKLIMTICVGYFAYDSVWCLYYQTEGLIMYLHHIAALITLIATIAWGSCGAEVVTSIMCGEITNPLLQTRWFLRETQRKDTILFAVVDISFMIMFFFSRMVVGTYLLIHTLRHPLPHIILKIGGLALWSISVVFMGYIFHIFWKKYLKPLTMRLTNSQLSNVNVSSVTNLKRVFGNDYNIMRHAEFMKPCKVE